MDPRSRRPGRRGVRPGRGPAARALAPTRVRRRQAHLDRRRRWRARRPEPPAHALTRPSHGRGPGIRFHIRANRARWPLRRSIVIPIRGSVPSIGLAAALTALVLSGLVAVAPPGTADAGSLPTAQ